MSRRTFVRAHRLNIISQLKKSHKTIPVFTLKRLTRIKEFHSGTHSILSGLIAELDAVHGGELRQGQKKGKKGRTEFTKIMRIMKMLGYHLQPPRGVGCVRASVFFSSVPLRWRIRSFLWTRCPDRAELERVPARLDASGRKCGWFA